MALTFDLTKSQQKLVLSLQKAGIVTPPSVDLAFVLDVSGSFEDEHREGVTNALLTRLVPWGMTFDPDQKLDVFTFSDGEASAHYVGEVNPRSYEDYVARTIIGRVPGWNGATEYSWVLEQTLRHFGWMQPKPKGFFSKLFAGGAPEKPPARRKSLVIFVTDGDNSDKIRTEEVLAASQARGDEVYFLFLGVSNQGGRFPFLKKIGDRFDNTGLVVISDIRGFVSQTDEQLNATLLGDELVRWLKR